LTAPSVHLRNDRIFEFQDQKVASLLVGWGKLEDSWVPFDKKTTFHFLTILKNGPGLA
jgi:hypothetical protein